MKGHPSRIAPRAVLGAVIVLSLGGAIGRASPVVTIGPDDHNGTRVTITPPPLPSVAVPSIAGLPPVQVHAQAPPVSVSVPVPSPAAPKPAPKATSTTHAARTTVTAPQAHRGSTGATAPAIRRPATVAHGRSTAASVRSSRPARAGFSATHPRTVTRRQSPPSTALGTTAHHTARRTQERSLPNSIGHLIPLPLPVPDWSKPIMLLLLAVAAGASGRALLAGRRARRLGDDLATMQPVLVPELPERIGTLNVSVAYRPAEGPAAGGDFYDVFPLAGRRTAIILGDVSGHGPAALARATHMRYMLRAYLEAGLEPRAALELTGRVLGVDPDGQFATVMLAVHDPASASLTYAPAGHPAPLTGNGPGYEPNHGCASPALGWGVPTGRRQTTIPLANGSWACFFSDGLTEARTGDRLLGRDGLADLLDAEPANRSAGCLLEQVRSRATEVRDDMAACVIVPIDGAPSANVVVEEVEVEAGDGERLRRFLSGCHVDDAERETALDRAREVALDHGTALVTLTVSETATVITVAEPVPGSATIESALPRPAPGTPPVAGLAPAA